MTVLPDPGFAGNRATVLLVCDRPAEINRWNRLLSASSFALVSGTFDQVVETWRELIPDLVLIDVNASHPDGVEVCRQLRQEAAVPLLVVFESSDEAQMLQAYRAGADDCLVKQLNPDLLLAKLNAWRRRSWTVPVEALAELQAGGVHLDPVRRMVFLESGRLVRLTNMEFRLLNLLMSHPGRIQSSADIVKRLWGLPSEAEGNGMLKNVVYRLRKKIEPDPANPKYLLTEPGIGYRFSGG